jgi:hypothetical protein
MKPFIYLIRYAPHARDRSDARLDDGFGTIAKKPNANPAVFHGFYDEYVFTETKSQYGA